MLKTVLAGAAAMSLSLAIGAGHASAETFDFSFLSAGGDVGAGSLVTSSYGAQQTVTGVTGTIDGSAITGLSNYASADEQLFLKAASYFSVSGISFSSAANISYNLTDFPDGANRITNSGVDPNGFGTPTPSALTSLTISAVPEPGVWAMMLMGVALMGASLRFTRKRGLAALAV